MKIIFESIYTTEYTAQLFLNVNFTDRHKVISFRQKRKKGDKIIYEFIDNKGLKFTIMRIDDDNFEIEHKEKYEKDN